MIEGDESRQEELVLRESEPPAHATCTFQTFLNLVSYMPFPFADRLLLLMPNVMARQFRQSSVRGRPGHMITRCPWLDVQSQPRLSSKPDAASQKEGSSLHERAQICYKILDICTMIFLLVFPRGSINSLHLESLGSILINEFGSIQCYIPASLRTHSYIIFPRFLQIHISKVLQFSWCASYFLLCVPVSLEPAEI